MDELSTQQEIIREFMNEQGFSLSEDTQGVARFCVPTGECFEAQPGQVDIQQLATKLIELGFFPAPTSNGHQEVLTEQAAQFPAPEPGPPAPS